MLDAQRRGDDSDDDLKSLLAHEPHFLERTVRCQGEEMERAMRLYRQPAVVRQVISRLLPRQQPSLRVAIALSPRPPSAHVIVTRKGAFVTCLAPGMSPKAAPVLPFAAFSPGLDDADSAYEQAITQKRQLQQLPPDDLVTMLIRGPGHLHRESVQVLERLPLTYVLPTEFTLEDAAERVLTLQKAQERVMGVLLGDRHNPRSRQLWDRVWRRMMLGEATIKMGIHLLGAMDSPAVTERLGQMFDTPSPIFTELAFALARHHGGGPVLLTAARRQDLHMAFRAEAGDALSCHCLLHPRNAPKLAASLLREPLAAELANEQFWLYSRRLARALPQEAEEIVGEILVKVPELPELAPELFAQPSRDLLLALGLHKSPVAGLFPPRDAAPDVQGEWDRFLRAPPDPEMPRVKQVVRSGPRTGRNEPCRCGSGKKFKRCCEGQQHG